MKRSTSKQTTGSRAALRRMAAAGLNGRVVERCPSPRCDICAGRLRPAA